MTVGYTIVGTATNGTDYVSLPTTVTIPAGASTASVNVTPQQDSTVEPMETVTLTISTNAAYIRGIDINDLRFDPDAWAARLEAACRETSETYTWRFEVPCMKRFQLRRLEAEVRRAAG